MLEQDGPPNNNVETTLLNAASLTTGGTLLDVSPFLSAHIFLDFQNANRSCFLEFETASGISTRRMQINSGFRAPVTGQSRWSATVPMRGERLRIGSSVNGAVLATVVGSMRPADKISQDVIDADEVTPTNNDRLYLWSEGANTLPTANTLDFDLYPWYGSITADISLTSTAVMGTSHTAWQRSRNGALTVMRRDAITADPLTNQYGVTSTIACTGDALRFSIVNNSGLNFTNVHSVITPTGGFGL